MKWPGAVLCALGRHDMSRWEVTKTDMRDATAYERTCRRGCGHVETFVHTYGGPMRDRRKP